MTVGPRDQNGASNWVTVTREGEHKAASEKQQGQVITMEAWRVQEAQEPGGAQWDPGTLMGPRVHNGAWRTQRGKGTTNGSPLKGVQGQKLELRCNKRGQSTTMGPKDHIIWPWNSNGNLGRQWGPRTTRGAWGSHLAWGSQSEEGTVIWPGTTMGEKGSPMGPIRDPKQRSLCR